MKIKTLAKLLVLPMLILPGCKAKEEAGGLVGSVTIRDVKYDGDNNRITWRIVTSGLAVVSNYTVTVNGEQKTINYNGSAGSYTYNAGGNDFDFSIVCNDNLERHAEYSTTFINLGRVQDLAYDGDGFVSWNDPVGLADFYTVKLNNKESTVNECKVAIQPGRFNVQVRPTGTPDANGNLSTYSKWSESFSGTLLAAPGGLSFDSERISWNTVSGASSYTLTVNGNEIPGLTTSSYPFAGHQEDLSIAVKAVGDGQSVYDSQYTTTQDYKYLAPVNMQIQDGVIKWDPPAGATRYKYRLNGVLQETFLTEPKYDKLVAGIQTRLQVLPMGPGDNTYSQWSSELSVIVLESPQLMYNNNVISWNSVTGAGGYAVRVTDPHGQVSEVTLAKDTYTYTNSFETPGTWYVSVKANGDTTQGYYDSQFSVAKSIYRLPNPGTYDLKSDPEATTQLSITCAAVTYATGYTLIANNKEVGNNTEPKFDVDVNSLDDRKDRLDIAFKIVAKGSANGSPIALDSEPLEFNATRLATPTGVSSSNSVLYWDPVSDANGYIVTVDDNSNRYKITNTQFDLKLLTPGTHNVYVQAYGNGTNLIASRTSDPITITRLVKPIIYVTKEADSPRYFVEWQGVAGATNYVVKVGEATYNVDNARFFNLYNNESRFTPGQGTQLSVMAIGNGSDTIDSEYSDTLTIIRHSRPTNLALYGNNLQWQCASVDGVAPTHFEISIAGTVTKTESISGSTYDLSSLPAGQYNATVKVLGEYNNCSVDSEYSDTFTFRKLAKVSNIVKSGTKISWGAVSYATRYDVRISGITNPIQVTEPEIDVKPYIGTSAGFKDIKITAIGDSSTILNSDEYVISQELKTLTRPAYIDDASTNQPAFTVVRNEGEVTITIDAKTTNHTGYLFNINDNNHPQYIKDSSTANVYKFTITEKNRDYGIQVALLGDAFGEDGIYYLRSNFSDVYTVRWPSL